MTNFHPFLTIFSSGIIVVVENSLMNDILVWMENLVNVSVLTLIFIGIRLLWMRFRKRWSSPPMDTGLYTAWGIVAAGVVLMKITLSLDPFGAIFLLLACLAVTYTVWDIIRSQHPGSSGANGNKKIELKSVEAGAPARPKDYTMEGIDTLIIALILVFGIIRPFFLQTFFIPSGSMEPTLFGPFDPRHPGESSVPTPYARSGDKLIANKFVYNFRAPERGDVVVFTPPEEAIVGNNQALITRAWLTSPHRALTPDECEIIRAVVESDLLSRKIDPGKLSYKYGKAVSEDDLLYRLPKPPARRDDYIKRVIGAPGDRIRIVADDGIYINGQKLREEQATDGLHYEEGHRINTDRYSPNSPSTRSIPDPQTGKAGEQPSLERLIKLANPERNTVNPPYDYAKQIISFLNSWAQREYLYGGRIVPHLQKNAQGVIEFVVPNDSIFVMGDNRAEGGSFDSRYWGVVPLTSVKARAVSTFWPATRLKLL